MSDCSRNVICEPRFTLQTAGFLRPDVLSLGTMMLAIQSQWLAILLAIQVPGVRAHGVANVDLKPETLQAFNRYIQFTEVRINREVSPAGKFLYADGLPPGEHSQVLAALRRGEMYLEQLQTLDGSGQKIEAPGAIIHHWLATIFVPGADLQQTLSLMENYDHHQDIYKPEVVRSRLLSREGNDFKIYYRLRKKKIITVTLNTNHDIHYARVDSNRWYSRSYSTRIAEVVNADTPNEREKPVGHDGGFLWRINSYWKFEAREGGVYIECESISLTRDIPAALAWLIKPFVTGIPKESLEMTMGSTRAALEAGKNGN